MSQHWYSRDGSACHYQPDGAATTLKHARTDALVPSVSTVLSVIAKEQLVQWMVRQGILAALTLERKYDEPDDQYLDRVMRDSRQQVTDAANEGTRIHAAIEAHFARKRIEPRYRPHVYAVRERLEQLFPDVTDWVSEKSFSHRDGFGGCCDLHSPRTGIVVDFKSKDGDFSDGKKLAYDQQYQLAAYQEGLGLPRTEGVSIFVSRTHPGAIAHHVWSAEDMEQGWRVFRAALDLWKAIKRYDGGWE
jgi:hypothetical protein